MEFQGFSITPVEKLRVQQLLSARYSNLLTEEGIEELGTLLAPLLVKNALQQQQFYKIYKAYTDEIKTLPKTDVEPPPPPPWWEKYLPYLLTFLLLSGILAFLYFQQNNSKYFHFFRIKEKGKNEYLSTNPNVQVGTYLEFENHSEEVHCEGKEFHWKWTEEKSENVIKEKQNTRHWNHRVTAPKEGQTTKYVYMHTMENGEEINRDSSKITIICSDAPPLKDIQKNVDSIQLRQPVQFSVAMESKEGYEYEWNFGDGSPKVNEASPIHQFEEVGKYLIQLKVENKLGDSPICFSTAEMEVNLNPTLPELITYDLQKDLLSTEWKYAWATWLLILSTLGWALWNWWNWYRRPDEKELEKEKIAAAFKANWEEPDDDAPYTIPFENKNPAIDIQLEQFNMAKLLRQRQEGTRLEMDVTSTVKATVEGGGFPSVQYQYNTRPTDYVFLIDLYSIESHQARLFQYLVGIWGQQDVHFDLFYYKKDLSRLWDPNGQKSFSLKELHRLLPQRRLVIFGDAYGVLNPNETPALQPSLVNLLRKWEERLLITPVPIVSWTFKEARLYQLFPIFHADLAGLLQATQFIGSGKTEEDLPPTLRKWENYLKRNDVDVSTDYDWEDLDDHEEYLENHPEVFRWLKALMVHPKPTWNITIAIGKAIGAPVTYENLLLLARIPWLKNGDLDLDLWEEVLSGQELSKEDELKAREAVKAELEAVKKRYPTGFFRREMETDLMVHDFALNPQDENNQERIRLLMGQKYLDPVVKEELDWVVRRHVNDFEEGKEVGKTIELFLEKETPQPQGRVATPQFWQAVTFSILSLILLFFTSIVQSNDWYNWIDGEVPEEGVASADSLRHLGFIKEVANAPDLAVELNNEAVDMLNGIAPFERSLNYSPPYDNVDGLFGNLSNEDKMIAIYFLAAIAERKKKNQEYELAEANLGHFIHNKGVEEYSKYTNQDSFLYKASDYFRFSMLVASSLEEYRPGFYMELDLHAKHGLGLTYHYLGKIDSACMVLENILFLSGGTYFAEINKNKYPNLLNLIGKKCVKELDADSPVAKNIDCTLKITEVRKNLDTKKDELENIKRDRKLFEKVELFVSSDGTEYTPPYPSGITGSTKLVNILSPTGRRRIQNIQNEIRVLLKSLPACNGLEKKIEEEFRVSEADFALDPDFAKVEVETKKDSVEIRTETIGDGLEITKNYLTNKKSRPALKNNSYYKIRKLKGIVLHLQDLDDKMDAKKLRNYYDITDKYKSSHYVVDDQSIIQCIPDDEIAYHVGGVMYTDTGERIREGTLTPNYFLLGVQIVINENLNVQESKKKTISLLIELLNKYNFSIDDLYMSSDVVENKKSIDTGLWEEIRSGVGKGVTKKSDEGKTTIVDENTKPEPQVLDLRIPKMIRVEGGTFTMGCQKGRDQDCQNDEYPSHDVTVPSFEISQYEVTEKEFADFLLAYRDAKIKKSYSVDDLTYGKYETGSSNRAVRNVTWYGAVEYCKWLSREKGGTYRLPTEAEWEYAARGGVKMTDYKYAGGDNIDKVAVHSANNVQEVGSKAPNLLNLYDMTGNVYEWCQDCWEKSYDNTPIDGSAVGNSKGSDCSRRVLRGGAFNDTPYEGFLRVADRYNLRENVSGSNIGFRVVTEAFQNGKVYQFKSDLSEQPRIVAKSAYRVQLGVFKELKNVLIQANKFEDKYPVFFQFENSSYRFLIGNFQNEEDAKRVFEILKDDGVNGFIRKI